MCSWLLPHTVYPACEAGGREMAHKTVHTNWQCWRPYILLAWLSWLPGCVSVTLAVLSLCATLSLTEGLKLRSRNLHGAIDVLYEKSNHFCIE